LQTKEEEDTAKEAFNGAAFAQFLFGPCGRQAKAVLLALRIPGDDGDGSQRAVNPVDELQTPIAGVQADETRADGVEADGQFQEGTGKGGIMAVGRGDQEMHRQAGAATEQGMDAIATQEGVGMVRRSVTGGRIGVRSAPDQDGSAIDDQIAGSDEPSTYGTPDGEHEEGLKRRRSCRLPAFAQLGRTGDTRVASRVERQATSYG